MLNEFDDDKRWYLDSKYTLFRITHNANFVFFFFFFSVWPSTERPMGMCLHIDSLGGLLSYHHLLCSVVASKREKIKPVLYVIFSFQCVVSVLLRNIR